MSATASYLKDETGRRKRAIELWETRVEKLTEAATGGKTQTAGATATLTPPKKKA